MKRYKEYEIDTDDVVDIGDYLTENFQGKRIINIVPEFDVSGWGINTYYVYTEEDEENDKNMKL